MIEYQGKILFSHGELRCPRTNVVELARGFESQLKALRVEFDQPMIVTSCCRSKEYNADLDNSHPHSLHVFDYPYWPTGGTCAIDISIANWDTEKFERLYDIAWKLGWSIGISPGSFVHLDRRSDYIPASNPKSKQTEFFYG